jgi:hypothetical protein
MFPRTARRIVMDPTTTFCPNRNCPARGQTGQGNIVPQYTYLAFLKYFALANTAVIAILEVLRRIFYYIILGRFRPPKIEPTS